MLWLIAAIIGAVSAYIYTRIRVKGEAKALPVITQEPKSTVLIEPLDTRLPVTQVIGDRATSMITEQAVPLVPPAQVTHIPQLPASTGAQDERRPEVTMLPVSGIPEELPQQVAQRTIYKYTMLKIVFKVTMDGPAPIHGIWIQVKNSQMDESVAVNVYIKNGPASGFSMVGRSISEAYYQFAYPRRTTIDMEWESQSITLDRVKLPSGVTISPADVIVQVDGTMVLYGREYQQPTLPVTEIKQVDYRW